MPWTNEAAFLAQTLFTLAAVLVAVRLGQIWVVGLICAMLVLMNLFVVEPIRLFGLNVTGGNVLYASVFLATDLLAEHWGKRAAYRAVRIGFCVSVFFLGTSLAILSYAPDVSEFAEGVHAALRTLLAPQWRIIGASMVSYLTVQHLDVYLYEWLRRRTGGRWLWLRNNGSTWVSQGIDSVLFTVLAFGGHAGYSLGSMILFTYAVKLIVAALDTPFIYLSKTRLFAPTECMSEAA